MALNYPERERLLRFLRAARDHAQSVIDDSETPEYARRQATFMRDAYAAEITRFEALGDADIV